MCEGWCVEIGGVCDTHSVSVSWFRVTCWSYTSHQLVSRTTTCGGSWTDTRRQFRIHSDTNTFTFFGSASSSTQPWKTVTTPHSFTAIVSDQFFCVFCNDACCHCINLWDRTGRWQCYLKPSKCLFYLFHYKYDKMTHGNVSNAIHTLDHKMEVLHTNILYKSKNEHDAAIFFQL